MEAPLYRIQTLNHAVLRPNKKRWIMYFLEKMKNIGRKASEETFAV